MSLFANNFLVKQIEAEVLRDHLADFELISGVARRHFDLIPGIELAKLISELTQDQYKLFDRWFSEQPRYNFAVAVRTALALCVAIKLIEK
ncbi:MAG: hypothetical protein WC505_06730 [Patescibacteria group bacterium]